MPLRQSIHGIAAKLGIRSLQSLGLVDVNLAPLLQGAVTEIGGEIDHAHTPCDQVRCKPGGHTIGEAEDSKVSDFSDAIGIGRLDQRVVGKGQKRTDRTPTLTSAALTAKEGHRQTRVIQQQSQGL